MVPVPPDSVRAPVQSRSLLYSSIREIETRSPSPQEDKVFRSWHVIHLPLTPLMCNAGSQLFHVPYPVTHSVVWPQPDAVLFSCCCCYCCCLLLLLLFSVLERYSRATLNASGGSRQGRHHPGLRNLLQLRMYKSHPHVSVVPSEPDTLVAGKLGVGVPCSGPAS